MPTTATTSPVLGLEKTSRKSIFARGSDSTSRCGRIATSRPVRVSSAARSVTMKGPLPTSRQASPNMLWQGLHKRPGSLSRQVDTFLRQTTQL
jgi:hypothetical protein